MSIAVAISAPSEPLSRDRALTRRKGAFRQDCSPSYYRARYYDSSAGRFVSEDSVRFDANDANFYRYVKNGPADFADPSGNTIVPVLGSGASAGLNLTDYYTALKYLN